MTEAPIKENVSFREGRLSFIDKFLSIFFEKDDSSKFDEILNNKKDILLFDKTVNELRRTNTHSKEIILSDGRSITVSIK